MTANSPDHLFDGMWTIAFGLNMPYVEDIAFVSGLRSLLRRAASELRPLREWTESEVQTSPQVRESTEKACGKAMTLWRARAIRDRISAKLDAGRITPDLAARLNDVLAVLGARIELDEPEAWIERWSAAEEDRVGQPMGISDLQRRQVLQMLLDITYQDSSREYVRGLGANGSEVDEIVQSTASRLFKLVLSADRIGGDVLIDHASAYVKKVLRHSFIDLRRSPSQARRAYRPIEDVLVVDKAAEASFQLTEFQVDWTSLARDMSARAWSAPAVLGSAFDAQWRCESRTRAKATVALRFALASWIIAQQRRSDSQIVVDGIMQGLARPIEDDDGLWLKPTVNRALGALDPTWAAMYAERLPTTNRAAEGVRGKESSDERYLARVCRGDGDHPDRPGDSFGPESVRRYGVGALARLVWGDLVEESAS